MLLRLVSKSASNFSRTIILMSGSLKSKFIIFKTRSRVCRIFLRFHEIFSELWIYLTSVKEALLRLKYSSDFISSKWKCCEVLLEIRKMSLKISGHPFQQPPPVLACRWPAARPCPARAATRRASAPRRSPSPACALADEKPRRGQQGFSLTALVLYSQKITGISIEIIAKR